MDGPAPRLIRLNKLALSSNRRLRYSHDLRSSIIPAFGVFPTARYTLALVCIPSLENAGAGVLDVRFCKVRHCFGKQVLTGSYRA